MQTYVIVEYICKCCKQKTSIIPEETLTPQKIEYSGTSIPILNDDTDEFIKFESEFSNKNAKS